MEQQVVFQERPRAMVGGKVFLVLEMIFLIFSKLSTFVSKLFLDDAASNIPSVMVWFWIVFFAYIAGYILLLIGTSSRNSIGVLIAGFVIFLLLEWGIVGFTNIASFTEKLTRLSVFNSICLYAFTFVWVTLIVLTCIKKAPKALCLIPGLVGVAAGALQLYAKLMEISMWSSLSGIEDGKEIAYYVFSRIGQVIMIAVILFRPFWIFMTAHWLTHPTKKIPVRQGFRPITPQPVQPYGAQPYQQNVYQPVQQPYQPMQTPYQQQNQFPPYQQ